MCGWGAAAPRTEPVCPFLRVFRYQEPPQDRGTQCCREPGSALRMPYAALSCPCSSQVPSPSLQALKPPVTPISRRVGWPMQAFQQNQKQPLNTCPRWRHSQTCGSETQGSAFILPTYSILKPKVPSLRQRDLEPKSSSSAVGAAKAAFRRVELTPRVDRLPQTQPLAACQGTWAGAVLCPSETLFKLRLPHL